jgi:signal transduction histidine kinase
LSETAERRRVPPAALIPPNERERLEAVRRYDILDTPADGAFDRITALAARVFGVPISIVSIVDSDRIWFKSRYGVDVTEIPRHPGLCASAILQYEPWLVTDAEVDPRTLTNPLVVGELGLRFYAGAPLTTRGGYNLGTLNVIETEPREMDAPQIATLKDLAAIVVDELELRLTARREEQSLERLKSEFVATASHQLRTPLAGIYGAAMTLQRAEANSSEELRGQLVDVIACETRRLTDAVEQIVLARTLEKRRFRILAERFDPIEIARASVDAARERLPDNLAIELVGDSEATAVRGDAVGIHSVLESLIDSAIKYSPAGGRIEVGVRLLSSWVRFWVRDEGLGIPASEQERVFARFHRLDPELSRGVAGAGLGLYICRELVWQMNSRIWFESSEGHGSTFVFETPTSARGGRHDRRPAAIGVGIWGCGGWRRRVPGAAKRGTAPGTKRAKGAMLWRRSVSRGICW